MESPWTHLQKSPQKLYDALKNRLNAWRSKKVPNIPYRVQLIYGTSEVDIEFSIEEEKEFKGKEKEIKDALSLLEDTIFPHMTNQALVERIKNLLTPSKR